MKKTRTRTIVCFLIILPMLISACAQAETPPLTEADFTFLDIGVSFEDVVTALGEPDREIGEGKYVFVYPLNDGREMFLTFETLDQVTAAVIRSASGSFDVILSLEN